MKILLSLLFLPFAIIVGLIQGILSGVFGAKNLKYIPKIIEHLANNPSLQGSAVQGIKYGQALAYAEEVGMITYKESNYFEFDIEINSTEYSVKVNRAHDTSSFAIFHSLKKAAPLSSVVNNQEFSEDNVQFDISYELLTRSYETHKKTCQW